MNGATIYIRDVAHVRDGYPPQTNVVRSDGQRGSLMTILKSGDESTIDIIAGIRKLLPTGRCHAAAPSSASPRLPISRFLCVPPSAAWCVKQ